MSAGRKCGRCGQSVSASLWNQNVQGTRHRAVALLRGWLSDPRQRFTVVAERLGISAERVRQIARDLGLGSGHARQIAWREQRLAREVARLFRSLPVYGRRGFAVHGVVKRYGSVRQLLQHTVEINGHRCAVRTACQPPNVLRRWGRNWVRLRPPRWSGPVEFVLYRLPPGLPARGWLVVPAHVVPAYSALISVGGRWRQYLNAWGQLRA